MAATRTCGYVDVMRVRHRILLLMLCVPGIAAGAQVLERLPLPSLPLPEAQQPLPRATAALERAARPFAAQARSLLRRHRATLARDERGMPVMRAVIIALSPDPQAISRALERGYLIQDDRELEGLGERLVTLVVPDGTSTEAALRELRAADPSGQYDFDHLFIESGSPPVIAPASTSSTSAAVAPVDVRVGLIDGGVDGSHPVFRRRPPRLGGCAGSSTPSAHGTAVASLFVGWSEDFMGAAPGAALHAIDVYCSDSAPGGRVRDVVSALGELAAAQVRIINLSIVGPDNRVLAAAVRAVQARAILIVAASGNDGANARPLYPAAYAGVIAVSAVDDRRRVLPEASGGSHVSFAAPGADLRAAAPGGAFQHVRGTSFAAPLVAGLLARELARTGASPDSIVQQLVASAQDRGARGRDPRYGHGLVGTEFAARGLMGRPAGD